MSHSKDFDAWNVEKKKLNGFVTKSIFIHPREVWWISVGVNIGTEIDGKHDNFERPVLVLQKLGREQFLGVPLTSRRKEGAYFLPVTYQDSEGSACLSQIRVFSTKRLLRKLGRVRKEDHSRVCQSLSQFLLTGRL